MALEDHFGDVIGKARAGLGMDLETVARAAAMTPDQLKEVESEGGAGEANLCRHMRPYKNYRA